MSSLVLELQQDTLNPNVRVVDLVRKSLVVARKLGLTEFEAWISSEMNGYNKEGDIPEYRELHGLPVAYSHYHGWYRLMTFNLSDEVVENMTTFRFHQPINYFEPSDADKRSSIIVTYTTAAEKKLMAGLDNRAIPAVQFDPSQFKAVLDAVRNIILEWTLRLESEGILGENMTFTNEERHRVSSTHLSIGNIINQVIQTQHNTDNSRVRVGDTYEGGQVGAMGRNAHAHDMTLNQTWNQLQGSVDLSQLANELSRLRHEMKKESVEPEHDIAVSEIAQAEQSAKSGDGSRTLEHLKSAGKWALDIATKIGSNLAVEAIKKSMGG